MMPNGSEVAWEERDVYVPGSLDRDRQTRAEAVLGQLSYWLLASRAYRYLGLRTYLVEVIVREFVECLRHPRSDSAFLSAEILLWAAWSHWFMHLEDVSALLDGIGRFGKQWDTEGRSAPDAIYQHYMSFGDPGSGSGASPQSVFEKVTSRVTEARRALWLPSRKEWGAMHRGVPAEGYALIVQTAENLRRVTREVLVQLRSPSGRKWYESYLRFKHGMPMVALDLFHTKTTMHYRPAHVPAEHIARADAANEARKMRILMTRPPLDRGGSGPHLQSFDCDERAAKQVLGSSRLLSEVEEYICRSVVHRAESEGARSFWIIRKVEGTPNGQGAEEP